VTAAARFPGVDLIDADVPAAHLNAAGRSGPGRPGPEHPSSAESEHSSVPWWEKSQTQAGPTRTS
jgi:hypothetical protein